MCHCFLNVAKSVFSTDKPREEGIYRGFSVKGVDVVDSVFYDDFRRRHATIIGSIDKEAATFTWKGAIILHSEYKLGNFCEICLVGFRLFGSATSERSVGQKLAANKTVSCPFYNNGVCYWCQFPQEST